MSDRPCDFCGYPKTSRCTTYYPEKGKEEPFDGWLCGQCHHGGPAKTPTTEPMPPRPRGTAGWKGIRI